MSMSSVAGCPTPYFYVFPGCGRRTPGLSCFRSSCVTIQKRNLRNKYSNRGALIGFLMPFYGFLRLEGAFRFFRRLNIILSAYLRLDTGVFRLQRIWASCDCGGQLPHEDIKHIPRQPKSRTSTAAESI